MHGYIEGITDTANISYCPKCGDEIAVTYSDGTAICNSCGFCFGVVECEEE